MTRPPARTCLLCEQTPVAASQALCADCFDQVPWELRGDLVRAVSGVYRASVVFARVAGRLAAWKAAQ